MRKQRKNGEFEPMPLSPAAYMNDLKGFLKAAKVGINPRIPSVDEIREGLALLGELPRMEMKNHCILLRKAGHTVRVRASQSCLSLNERQLVYRISKVL